MLSENGLPFEERDMVWQPITEAELRHLVQRVGIDALVNRKGAKFKQLGLAEKRLSEDEWIELLASDPDLVRRPIVVAGEEVIAGMDRDRIANL